MSEIRIAQYFKLVAGAQTLRYQNYFIGQSSSYLSESYDFAPFRAEGSLASLNGDNETLRILFPNIEVALRLVEQANGNRLSQLTFTTAWLNSSDQIITPMSDYYLGIGASYSETTIELRFRSAIDSVGSAFPARTLTKGLVGPLPLNSELYLR
jgi:hypothetical protein